MNHDELGSETVRIERTLTHIQRLDRSRHYRDERGLFFVEGVRNFVAAVDNACRFATVLYSDKLLTSGVARKLVRRLRRHGVSTVRVSPEQFRAVSRAQQASGVGAVLRQRVQRLCDVRPASGLVWVVLRHLRSPGNFGCLIRTSGAVNGAGFLLLDSGLDPFDPVVIRSSMGVFFRQRFVRASALELRRWVLCHRLQVIGATPEAKRAYDEICYRTPSLLVLGDERSGLDPTQRQLCDELVRIPMATGQDSLNVSVAGALLMYEVLRASKGSEMNAETPFDSI